MDHTTSAPRTTPLSPLTINLQDAITWTTNWREGTHQLNARSFTFHADEFRAILNETGVEKVRLYLALAASPDNPDELMEKLICVGVDKEGRDIIIEPGSTDNEGDEGTGIYDFSNPCPPLCSEANGSSPLD